MVLVTFDPSWHELYGTPEKVYLSLTTIEGESTINMDTIVLPFLSTPYL